MRNPRFYECGEGVEAHGNVRELVEQIEDEIASPNVRELVRQGREQIVLAELVGKKTFRQQKHGTSKAYRGGNRHVGRTPYGHGTKSKSLQTTACDRGKPCRDFAFISAPADGTSAAEHPQEARGRVQQKHCESPQQSLGKYWRDRN